MSGHLLQGVQPTDFYIEDEDGNRLAELWQVPLKLAWAITIHKSQGMPLDAAHIDLSYTAFTQGLGYVALSRVRTIDDLSMIDMDDAAIEVNPTALRLENRLQEDSINTLHCLQNERG